MTIDLYDLEKVINSGLATGIKSSKIKFLSACQQIGLLEDKQSWEDFKKSKVKVDEIFINPIGPPLAASGPTCPMQNPCVAPEKRPSVMRATSSPNPWP